MNIQVIDGNIVTVDVDAIATLINTGGMWFGGVDSAIHQVAGERYHAQAQAKLATAGKFADGYAMIARGDKMEHYGNFNDVVFVFDDLTNPLSELVRAALVIAENEAAIHTLALPAMRCGVMAGAYEATTADAVAEMFKGVRAHEALYPDSQLALTFVVYNDSDTLALMQAEMEKTRS